MLYTDREFTPRNMAVYNSDWLAYYSACSQPDWHQQGWGVAIAWLQQGWVYDSAWQQEQKLCTPLLHLQQEQKLCTPLLDARYSLQSFPFWYNIAPAAADLSLAAPV